MRPGLMYGDALLPLPDGAAMCDPGVHAVTPSPSVRRALPPVGVHRTDEQLPHMTTVWEWEKMVVLQPR